MVFFTQTINHSPGTCGVIQGKFEELKILVAIALFLGGETASSQSFPVLLVTAYLHFENSLKGAVAIISFTNLDNFFFNVFFSSFF